MKKTGIRNKHWQCLRLHRRFLRWICDGKNIGGYTRFKSRVLQLQKFRQYVKSDKT